MASMVQFSLQIYSFALGFQVERGVNNSLEISGNPYNKSEILYV